MVAIILYLRISWPILRTGCLTFTTLAKWISDIYAHLCFMWYLYNCVCGAGVASSPELLFPCPKCKNSYTTLPALHRHSARAHPDLTRRQHACSVCAKAFGTASKLRDHMLSHSGARPHRCDVCQRAFSHASNLRVHARIHTSEYTRLYK